MATGPPGPCRGDRGAAGPLLVPPVTLPVSRVPSACETSASSVRSERGGPTPPSCPCHLLEQRVGMEPPGPPHHPPKGGQGSLPRWFWSLGLVMWWHGDPLWVSTTAGASSQQDMGLELGAWNSPAALWHEEPHGAVSLCPRALLGQGFCHRGWVWLGHISIPVPQSTSPAVPALSPCPVQLLQHQESEWSNSSAQPLPSSCWLHLAVRPWWFQRDGGSARPSPPHGHAALGPSEPPKSCCCSHRLTRLSPASRWSQHLAPYLHVPKRPCNLSLLWGHPQPQDRPP